jgi:hypothetical protein
VGGTDDRIVRVSPVDMYGVYQVSRNVTKSGHESIKRQNLQLARGRFPNIRQYEPKCPEFSKAGQKGRSKQYVYAYCFNRVV